MPKVIPCVCVCVEGDRHYLDTPRSPILVCNNNPDRMWKIARIGRGKYQKSMETRNPARLQCHSHVMFRWNVNFFAGSFSTLFGGFPSNLSHRWGQLPTYSTCTLGLPKKTLTFISQSESAVKCRNSVIFQMTILMHIWTFMEYSGTSE